MDAKEPCAVFERSSRFPIPRAGDGGTAPANAHSLQVLQRIFSLPLIMVYAQESPFGFYDLPPGASASARGASVVNGGFVAVA
jgi:hypothetical protein